MLTEDLDTVHNFTTPLHDKHRNTNRETPALGGMTCCMAKGHDTLESFFESSFRKYILESKFSKVGHVTLESSHQKFLVDNSRRFS